MYKIIFIIISILFNINNKDNISITNINNKDNISITNINNTNYILDYKGTKYNVEYTYDNWKIYNSYKITNEYDMRIIVSKLINIHPIHSSDYKSYRTVDDLVYEWKQHNLAFTLLPNGKYKDMAKDVDLDPKDQNKSYLEMYNIREK